jgi:hypothetical protein
VKGKRVDDQFPELVDEFRWLGLCDDAIAARLGITVEGLHKRFGQFGIARGRRWRDIEDAHAEPVLTKAQVRAAGIRAAS